MTVFCSLEPSFPQGTLLSFSQLAWSLELGDTNTCHGLDVWLEDRKLKLGFLVSRSSPFLNLFICLSAVCSQLSAVGRWKPWAISEASVIFPRKTQAQGHRPKLVSRSWRGECSGWRGTGPRGAFGGWCLLRSSHQLPGGLCECQHNDWVPQVVTPPPSPVPAIHWGNVVLSPGPLCL